MIALTLLTIVGQNSFAQNKYSKLSVDRQMKDTFSFANQWDYDWDIFKDDDGKFSAADGRKIKGKDTTHFYFTTNSVTNIQGGYTIRYCFAKKINDTIALIFSDGLPAYASEFYIYICGDSFYFKPKTIYPSYIRGQKISYQVTKQSLTLNKGSYKVGDIIMGYVDIEFIETVSLLNKEIQAQTFYLRGYVKTPLKRPQKYGR